ncbi:response regulator transcription factor [Actinomyces sp. oral taxon 170]|uniref:response regulator transcription factor n=1 Tax=Actinomyces sp. oral taxon 170 TaxID=712117 RepID=UPI000205DB70|nr:response regulator transcription factor [Actinomyces sp. oral taxon 170]EGF55901.1 response regulator receiver domain protein [Actinomyces sp. oral taxon 170 str. F0386]
MDSPQRRVRVVIVDDDALVRAALRLILESDSGVTVLGEGSDGRSGYDAARSLRPDVVLMDLHMPGTDGVWATAQIAADCPDTKVLVLTAFDTDAMVAAALRAGATGFLLKDSAPEIIFRAVHAAADGQRAFSGSVLDRLVEAAVEATPQRRAFPETVTDRERQVALLVAQGLGNSEIAEELVVGASTVKTHVSALLDKFGVSNRVQLAVAVAECAVDDVAR